MSRTCEVTGSKPVLGNVIHRRGKPKKQGGIGTHVTAINRRTFFPNLKTKRIFVPELKRTVTVKLSVRALKTINKKGAFAVLKEAGVI
ncbi:MAG: 50S ribosomal protein L28 [Verrucomicrobiae bacterium]|nr:50S ribosomal protein L28 [Verrucomicrobiae bacterium]